eukprot:gene41775-51771_t
MKAFLWGQAQHSAGACFHGAWERGQEAAGGAGCTGWLCSHCRITVVADERFRTSGRVMLDAGWRVVWGGDRQKGDAPGLCAYEKGEAVRNQGVQAVGSKTKPPARYNESTLLGAMEKAGKTLADSELRAAIRETGLGTPATRAAIIEGLLSTGSREKPKQPYMTREGKEQFLVPTDKGDGLYEFLTRNNLSALTSAEMTASWEHRLQDVQHGRLARHEFMSGIGKSARGMIDVLKAYPEGFELHVGGTEPMTLSCRELINCAGLSAPEVASRITGLPRQYVPQARLCKGSYFSFSGRA